MGHDPRLEGITRRQALRTGILAGSLVWAAPAVQVIHMSKAFASETSPAVPENRTENSTTENSTTENSTTENSTTGNGTTGNGTTGNGTTGNAEVLGETVTAPQGTPSQPTAQVAAPTAQVGAVAQVPSSPEVTAQVIPQTGMEVVPLAALGGALSLAGAASLAASRVLDEVVGVERRDVDRPALGPDLDEQA